MREFFAHIAEEIFATFFFFFNFSPEDMLKDRKLGDVRERERERETEM